MVTALEHLIQAWNRAWLEKDVALVEKLMSAEYIYITPGGQALDRKAILEIIRSPAYRLEYGERTEILIKSVGNDSAAMVHRWRGEGAYEGNRFKDDHRCTMLCVRHEDEWQIVLEHCSLNN